MVRICSSRRPRRPGWRSAAKTRASSFAPLACRVTRSPQPWFLSLTPYYLTLNPYYSPTAFLYRIYKPLVHIGTFLCAQGRWNQFIHSNALLCLLARYHRPKLTPIDCKYSYLSTTGQWTALSPRSATRRHLFRKRPTIGNLTPSRLQASSIRLNHRPSLLPHFLLLICQRRRSCDSWIMILDLRHWSVCTAPSWRQRFLRLN